jgi:hypothetical protein
MNPEQAQKLEQARQARAAHVTAWRASGQTQAAYCSANRLNATTFSGWLNALKPQPQPQPRASQPIPASPLNAIALHIPNLSATALPPPNPIRIHLPSGAQIELPPQTCSSYVAALVRALMTDTQA